MTDTKLNINTGAADIFNNGWKHQQNSEVVENNSAEKMMYKLMFLLVRVAMAVVLISANFCIMVTPRGLADGGFGSEVKSRMLVKVKISSRKSKMTVPK